MSDTLSSSAESAEPGGLRAPAKAAVASWIGSMVEYYDFFIYGTAAALVFGKLFFPGSSPAAGTLLALATFGVGYIARPFGAVLLGHFGDKFGRKRVLVLTLLMMGTSTFLVGCLPSYHQIGIAAPIALVLLRLLQGLSAAGEQSGANSMTLEHAPANRRAFYTSFTLGGTQAGAILSTLVFIPVAALPDHALMTWGWRVPFFLSAIVVAVGYYVRRSMPETPAFKEVAKQNKVVKLPVAVLFRNYTADVVRVIFAALISVISTIFGIFTLSYGVNTVGLDRTPMLVLTVAANVVALVTIPLWGTLADRIGRKPVFIGGALGCAVLIFPFLSFLSAGNLPMVYVFGLLLSGVVYSAPNAIWPSFYAEMFDTKVRYSGMAIGTQIGFALGGFAPAISTALLGKNETNWMAVAIFTAAAALVSAGAAFTARETFNVHMNDLGSKKHREAAAHEAPSPDSRGYSSMRVTTRRG
jgi:MFS family permease